MAIQLALTLRQCKITRPRIPLIRFVKFREFEHGRQRELVLKLPKGLVTKLIPLLGFLFLFFIFLFQQVEEGPNNLRKILNEVVGLVGKAKQ